MWWVSRVRDGWWYLSRATGIVATVLAVAALVYGLFFSARNTGASRRANWWLDLHNELGGLTLIFTVAHLGAAYMDTNAGIGLEQILVPWTGHDSVWPLAWGVIATYLIVLTVATSWPRRRLSRRVWRIVHLSSIVAVALAMLHAAQLGSDAGQGLFEVGIVAATGFGLYSLVVRAFSVVDRRRAAHACETLDADDSDETAPLP
ncbi:MAG: Ferric reductase like transrane component [Ilumatobacteraceae bacterium]|nr:Ferric reductase like transrane component [Ilumatobacteraceae bacterium]